MTKAELRAEFLKRRAAEPASARAAAEAAAISWLRDILAASAPGDVVATYYSVRDEFPTGALISECAAQGRAVAMPRWDSSRHLYLWALLAPGAPLKRGPMGIPEPDSAAPEVPPSAIAIYLVPGLAFDSFGTRLGYGGGWFDRLLAAARPGAVIRGLCLPCQFSQSPLPREPHDIPAPPLPTAGRRPRHQQGEQGVKAAEATSPGKEPGRREFP